MITLTITDARLLAGVDASKAQHAPDQSAEVYMQAWLDQLLDSWAVAYKIGIVSSGDYVLRFTAAENAAITAAAETDPLIAGLLARVRESAEVVLYAPEVVQGVGYLVAQSLLTAKRAAEILSWDVPQAVLPTPEPASE
jgi:hypothetical protein